MAPDGNIIERSALAQAAGKDHSGVEAIHRREQTGMEASEHRARRIRRNAIIITLIMSVVATVFVIGMAVSYPEGLGIALVMGVGAVVLPVIGYLYVARWYAMLDW